MKMVEETKSVKAMFKVTETVPIYADTGDGSGDSFFAGYETLYRGHFMGTLEDIKIYLEHVKGYASSAHLAYKPIHPLEITTEMENSATKVTKATMRKEFASNPRYKIGYIGRIKELKKEKAKLDEEIEEYKRLIELCGG